MPPSPPLLTIATITLNNAQGIEKTWNSIHEQGFKGFEWLVQDGKSTDETFIFLKNTPAITESIADKGIYDAMNRLITRAKGKYILFLNAGDALASPDTLQTIAEHLENKPDFLYGDTYEKTQDGQIHFKTAREHTKIALGMFTHHQAMLYKTSVIGDLRYDNAYQIAADYNFTAHFLQRAENVKRIPATLCIFESGGISQTQTKIGRDEQFKIRKTLQLCNPIQNHIITMLQRLNMTLRNLAPNLYWSSHVSSKRH